MEIRKALMVAALLAAPFAAHAAETTYSDQASFDTAVGTSSDNTASDDFSDLVPGLIDTTTGPLDRTVNAATGTLDYSVDAANGIYVVDVDTDPTDGVVIPALSTNELTDSLFFSGFTNVNAIGGTFFNTDPDGVSVLSDLLLEIDIGTGSPLTFTLSNIVSPTFWGITLSDGYIQSLTVTNALADAFPTIGQLFFGTLAPTVVTPPTPPTPAPAPAVFALLLAGLAGAAALRRRAA